MKVRFILVLPCEEIILGYESLDDAINDLDVYFRMTQSYGNFMIYSF